MLSTVTADIKNCPPREGSRHFHANLNIHNMKNSLLCAPPHPEDQDCNHYSDHGF